MSMTDRFLTISPGVSNQNEKKLFSIAYGGNKVNDKSEKSIDEKIKLISLSTDYCQDVFACLACVLLLNPKRNVLLNPKRNVFREQNEKINHEKEGLSVFLNVFLDYVFACLACVLLVLLLNLKRNVFREQNEKINHEKEGLSVFLNVFLHYFYSPTEEVEYTKQTIKRITRYKEKISQAQSNIYSTDDEINKDAFSVPFDRLCLDFSVLPENVKKTATKFVLENLKEDKQASVAVKILDDVFSYHSQKEIELEAMRFEAFITNLENFCSSGSNTKSLFGLFIKNENNAKYSVSNLDNLQEYDIVLTAVLLTYTKRMKTPQLDVDQTSMLNTIKDKINKGLINAEDLAAALNRFNATNSLTMKNKILQDFLHRALLEKEDSKLEDSCYRKSLFNFLYISTLALKMIGTVLLDSAFFFGVAVMFKGFDISFVKGSTNSIIASIVLGIVTLAIWYSAGTATFYSRVAKTKKTIKRAPFFSTQPFEPEMPQGEMSKSALKIYIKRSLCFIAPIAAIASGLPAFYGVLKSVSKVAGAFGYQISKNQALLVATGLGVFFAAAFTFLCFYLFSMTKTIDEMLKKGKEKDNFFFFVTACFTLILGVIYCFSINKALVELAEFLQSESFNIVGISNQSLANLLQSPVFFTLLFGCLMIINFLSAIPKTAIMFTPSKPSVISQKNSNNIMVSCDITKQANRQLFAEAKCNLRKKRVLKYSIFPGDVGAFAVVGSIGCSNSMLKKWNCTHLEKGKIIYQYGTLGSDAMIIGSCVSLLITLAAIWYYTYKKTVEIKTHTVVISSISLLMLTAAFLFCGSLTSLFFTALVIVANVSVSLMFTHFPNIFPLGREVEDVYIKQPIGTEVEDADIKQLDVLSPQPGIFNKNQQIEQSLLSEVKTPEITYA